MRGIIFKVKRKNWRQLPKKDWWVEGLVWKATGGAFIIPNGLGICYDYKTSVMTAKAIEIDPETLCQYTGMTDKNGQKIWENDIVKHEQSETIGTVKWYQEDYAGWCVNDVVIDEQQFTDEMWSECEVIGNCFDNPELL